MARRRLAYLLAALALMLPLAGCIGQADGPTQQDLQSNSEPPQQDDGGQMTAEERTTEDEGIRPGIPLFYAERVVTVEGVLTLEALLATLSSMNGQISVRGGSAGEWSMVATMRGYGESPQEAREQRDRIHFDWSIGEPGAHRLVGQALMDEDDASDPGPIQIGGSWAEATLEVTVPKPLALSLQAGSSNGGLTLADLSGGPISADSSNGDVTAENIQVDRLELGTSNGQITARKVTARTFVATTSNGDLDIELSGVANGVLDTSNGAVTARILPGASGTVEVGSSNGNLQVQVPEDAEHGYDATLDTSNGKATVRLQDGTTRTDDDGEEATFVTDGYSDRAIRTQLILDTSNDDVTLGPA